MWTILGQKNGRFCDGLSRRTFLQVGSLASAGLTLPGLLSARTASAGQATGSRKPRSAILVYLAGGPSQYETFDPKPTAPRDIRGPYGPISTKVPGIQICETLPNLAKIADQWSLIRSCAHDNSGHGGGARVVQTGYKSASLEEELPHDYPAVGSIIAKVRGPMNNGMPTYMHLPNGGDGGPKFLGQAYDAFDVYSNGKPVGLDLYPTIKLNRMEDRRSLRAQLDRMARRGDEGPVMDSIDHLDRQAFEMLSASTARQAFDSEKESAATRERYGNHEAGKCLLLARRFIEAGAGIVTVRIGSWDQHGNAGGTVNDTATIQCPPLDQGLAALIADLKERGLSDDVVVWCWGEFGRTPRINNLAGRDHWPQAMSVLMAGGGIQPGRVVGATNNKGEHPVDKTLSPADALATVYHQLGIDTTQQFLNGAGRPISILPGGEPIRELL
jgi:hypothetical protein